MLQRFRERKRVPTMFYDVRIFDAKGRLKKTVTSKMHNQRHWGRFFDIQFNPKTPKNDKTSGKKRLVRSRIRQEYPDLYASESDF